MSNVPAAPMCCGQPTRWVVQGISLQYWFCDTCRDEPKAPTNKWATDLGAHMVKPEKFFVRKGEKYIITSFSGLGQVDYALADEYVAVPARTATVYVDGRLVIDNRSSVNPLTNSVTPPPPANIPAGNNQLSGATIIGGGGAGGGSGISNAAGTPAPMPPRTGVKVINQVLNAHVFRNGFSGVCIHCAASLSDATLYACNVAAKTP